MFAKPMKYDIANDVEIFGDCLVILHTIPSYKNKSIFMFLYIFTFHDDLSSSWYVFSEDVVPFNQS